MSPLMTDYMEQLMLVLEQVQGQWLGYQLLAICIALGVCSWVGHRHTKDILKLFDHPVLQWMHLSKRSVQSRIVPVGFLLLLWLELGLFYAITVPANTLLLNVCAKLALAWVLISLLASVIRNRFLFGVVSVSAWVVAALSILNLLNPVVGALDATAIHVGSVQLSLLKVLKALVLVAMLVWGVGFLSRSLEKVLVGTGELSPSMTVLLTKLVRIALIVVAVAVAMNAAGIDLTALAVFSGAVGVGLGFGLQKTVSNFLSGISLLLDKSIKPGDVISIGDTFGWISQINTRYTSVVTRSGREHLIPNENLITQEVVNWSYSNDQVRIDVDFGVSYEADPHKVRDVVMAKLHNDMPRVLKNPKPNVLLKGFGDSSVDFEVRFWIRDPAEGVGNIRSEVLFAIWDVLKENKIEIPYPKRDLYAPQGLNVTVTQASDMTKPGKKA